MARHAVVDIAQIFRTAPNPAQSSTRLVHGDLERIREILAKNGTRLLDGEGAEQRLAELRLMYEPYVCALSEMLLMPLPPWILEAMRLTTGKPVPGEEFNRSTRSYLTSRGHLPLTNSKCRTEAPPLFIF